MNYVYIPLLQIKLCLPENLYIEGLIPKVTVFGDTIKGGD